MTFRKDSFMNRLISSLLTYYLWLSLIVGIAAICPTAGYGQHPVQQVPNHDTQTPPHGETKHTGDQHQRSASPTNETGRVSISVDGATRYQTFDGFGATLTAFEKDGEYKRHDHNQPERVTATPADRQGIARMIYTQLGISRTRVGLEGFEPENDNDDPFTLNPAAFDWRLADAEINFVTLARPLGLQTWWASFEGSSRREAWAARGAWRRKPGSDCALNPALIDEEVEWLLAAALHYRERGVELKYMAVRNEPDLCDHSGKIDVADMVTIIKRLGKRLRDNKLNTRIVVSDGWQPANALRYMQAVLSDQEARQYVGALAYHSYDGFDNPSALLDTSARSEPPQAAVEVRSRIRDLAAQYRLPVWMTEVCYCTRRDLSDFDLVRARLNHVHDELTITNVAAFDAMNLFFLNRPAVRDELVNIYFRPDGVLDRYEISIYGYLLSHYSRFISPGSVRVKAESSDARVRVSAFERPDGSPVIVVINNNPTPVQANIALAGLRQIPRTLAAVSSQANALLQRTSDVPIGDTAEPLKGRSSRTFAKPIDQDIAIQNPGAAAMLPPLSITTFHRPGLADGLRGPGAQPPQPAHQATHLKPHVRAWDPENKREIVGRASKRKDH
jgi:O-glycosyl hydrolase